MPANPQTDTLLITCASGKQASNLLPLLSEWKHLRLAVHSPSSQQRLQKSHPNASVIQADLHSPSNCANLLRDVTVVIHINPLWHPYETSIGKMMIDAAEEEYKKGTLKHFIFSSVLNSTLSKMLNHYRKRDVEEYLVESGLPFTILQPSTFMDNLEPRLAMMVGSEKPVFKAMWDIDTRFSFTALRDMAEVMRKVVLERESHFYAVYPLVSTKGLLSTREAVGVISENLGREVKIEKMAFEDAVDVMVGDHKDDQKQRDAAERMLLFYENRGLLGNSSVMEMLLGRQATQFGAWVNLKVEKIRKGKEG